MAQQNYGFGDRSQPPEGAGNGHAHPLDQYSVQPKQNDDEQSPYYKSGVPTIELPKGGGALKGIDEKFSVNAVNGTAGLQVGFPLTPGRGGFTPALSLSYSSGSGNSEFGLGWSMSLPAIQRRTDKQLPQYKDAEESDVFLLAGAEDLVPAYDDSGVLMSESVSDNNSVYHVKRYRPRIEGLFARIELISKEGSVHTWWRVTTKDNICTYYGLTLDACIADPSDNTRIYKWLPQLSIDNRGNAQEYIYASENSTQVPRSVQEQNRISGLAPFANKYLKRVKYCNKQPYFIAGTDFYNAYLLAGNSAYAPVMPSDAPSLGGGAPVYLMEAVLDYGDHTDMPDNSVSYDASPDWPCRKDPFSDFHAGFEIRTYRTCQRVLMFHSFKELGNGTDFTPVLVRSLDLTYAGSETSDELIEADYITYITQTGYKKTPDGSAFYKKSLPPMQLEYQSLQWDNTVHAVSAADTTNAPQGLTGAYQWTDLWGEGLPGILTEQGTGWFYKSNLGDGHFSAAVQVAEKPSFNGLGTVLQWSDLNADGRRQVVCHDPVQGYFELKDTAAEGGGTTGVWEPFQSFEHTVNVDWNSPYTKMLDLDGDGRPDLLVTDDRVWTWYKNEGTGGMVEGGFAAPYFDEEKGPKLVLNDLIQSIFLADMNGDGMTDIVRIKNGEVCYWPNLGYGRFGAKVTMRDAPVFAPQDIFNPMYLYLSDVSGTGAADLLYADANGCYAWINLAGNGWSGARQIAALPAAEPYSKIAVLDFLGNGTGCIVWSSPLPGNADTPMRYIDLMGGYKPYLMRCYKNGMGKTVHLDYKSSTKYYLEDKAAGTPWATRLPFPVQCLSEVVTSDIVSETSYIQSYSYHHGYYDHEEREFRGFGRVDTVDTDSAAFYSKNDSGAVIANDLDQAHVLSKSWYHTGAWIRESTLLEAFAKEYYPAGDMLNTVFSLPDISLSAQEQREAYRAVKGSALRQEVYALDGNPQPYTITATAYTVQLVQLKQDNRYACFLPLQQQSLAFSCERNVADPRIAHTLTLATDCFGNVLESASVVYPRKGTNIVSSLPAVVQQEQSKMHVTYTVNTMTTCLTGYNSITDYIDMRGHYRLYMPGETKTYELTGIALPQAGFWDLTDLHTACTNATEIEYATSPTGSSTAEKRLLSCHRVQYWNCETVYPLGMYGIDGLAYREYSLAFTDQLLQDAFGITPTTSRVDETMLTQDGGYHRSADINGFPAADPASWLWLKGGYAGYSGASSYFIQPISFYTSFDTGAGGRSFWGDYYLLNTYVYDALYNYHTVLRYNWYTLQPELISDENGNFTEVCYDVLGMPVSMAVMGKGTEADYLQYADGTTLDPDSAADKTLQAAFLTDPVANAKAVLGRATWRCVYDLTASPVSVAMIAREEHYVNNADSNVILRFSYTDGFGRVAMHKAQGPGIDTTGDPAAWIGSGKTVYNNKGSVVLQYEPYFSSTHTCDTAEQAANTGVSPRMHYDSPGRVVRTDMPDGSFSKTTWDSWQQIVYDANDTTGDWVNGVLEDTSDWYAKYSGSTAATEAQDAARKAAQHANTPSVVHLDSLGRAFYTIQQYRQVDPLVTGDDPFYHSYAVLDITGNRLEVIDGLQRTQLQYLYSPLKAPLWQKSIDGGEGRVLLNVAGQPCYSWDAADRRFYTAYDILIRPERKEVLESGTTRILERILYGEAINTYNGRGRISMHYHSAGRDYVTLFNFQGVPFVSLTQLLSDKIAVGDWQTTDTSVLSTELYGTILLVDALGRPVSQRTELYTSDGDQSNPDSIWDPYAGHLIVRIGGDRGTTVHTYDRAGALYSVQVQDLQGQTKNIVTGINYDAKGQRAAIWYGNGTKTSYTYDPLTYRLTRLLTVNLNTSPNEILQDLNYWYDPVGNITTIRDNAQQTLFYNNTVVTPDQCYTYDALYRLVKAEGRELIGIASFGAQDNNDDGAWMNVTHKGDGNAVQCYIQQYSYDAVGNILSLQHTSGTGSNNRSYTRNYSYNTADNKLQQTAVATDTYNYSYDIHGNMLTMPHLDSMAWNQLNELAAITRGTTVTNYQYSGGQRVRKYTDKGSGNIKEERIYLGNYEIYRKFDGSSSLILERTTLHISDDSGRVAMIETRTQGMDDSPQQLQRFVYSNHLGSAALELNETGDIISYEEYHPYGTTSYQANSASINAVAKRYRYTGKERDEESGLYYHGARYYIPWLCRWSAVDPLESKYAPLSSYNYGFNNPITWTDDTGKGPNDKKKQYTSLPTTGVREKHTGSGYTGEQAPDVNLPEAVIHGGKAPAPDLTPAGGATPETTAHLQYNIAVADSVTLLSGERVGIPRAISRKSQGIIQAYISPTATQQFNRWLGQQSLLSPFAWATGHASPPQSAGGDLAKELTYFTPGIGAAKATTESVLGIVSGNATAGDYVNVGLSALPYLRNLSGETHEGVLYLSKSKRSKSLINPKKMDLWMSYLDRRGIKFEIGSDIAIEKLKGKGPGGYNPFLQTIFLRDKNPTPAAFFEEAFHAMQDLKGMEEYGIREGIEGVDLWEYEAKTSLIKHAEKLGLSAEEVHDTQMQLQEVLNKTYDK